MTLSAVLLTGGLSRRMGRDKATLVIEGQPLWSRQLSILRALKPQALFISARSAPAWKPADVEVLLDAPPSRGPLSGIVAALDVLRTTHLLVLAVDLPRMTAEHLTELVQAAGPLSGIIPRTEDYFEPLAAIYPKGAAGLARGSLASADNSLQSLACQLLERGLVRERIVSAEERPFYANLNSL